MAGHFRRQLRSNPWRSRSVVFFFTSCRKDGACSADSGRILGTDRCIATLRRIRGSCRGGGFGARFLVFHQIEIVYAEGPVGPHGEWKPSGCLEGPRREPPWTPVPGPEQGGVRDLHVPSRHDGRFPGGWCRHPGRCGSSNRCVRPCIPGLHVNDRDLPDEDHVVRYASPMLVLDNGGIDGFAFRLRRRDAGLSVNWLECFRGRCKSQQLDEVRRRSRITMRPNGRLAELSIGVTKAHMVKRGTSIRFVHRPLAAEDGDEADPSHGEMVGLPPGDSPEAAMIGDMIAECIENVHPALSGTAGEPR